MSLGVGSVSLALVKAFNLKTGLLNSEKSILIIFSPLHPLLSFQCPYYIII